MIICLGRPLPERLDATDPGVITPRDTRLPLYAVLLQVGFTEPAPSPGPLVRSYRTVSPLPAAHLAMRPLAVCFLLHFPWAHAPWELPSALPYGVRTFLERRPRRPRKRKRRRVVRDHLGDSKVLVTRSSVSLTSWSARALSSLRTATNRIAGILAAARCASA